MSNQLYLHTGVPYHNAYGWKRPNYKAQSSLFTYIKVLSDNNNTYLSKDYSCFPCNFTFMDKVILHMSNIINPSNGQHETQLEHSCRSVFPQVSHDKKNTTLCEFNYLGFISYELLDPQENCFLRIKTDLPKYICSLTTVWSSDAQELTTQTGGLSG